MLDLSNRHDSRDDDFTFDAPASGWLSHFPQPLLSVDTFGDMIIAVIFAAETAWINQLAMWARALF